VIDGFGAPTITDFTPTEDVLQVHIDSASQETIRFEVDTTGYNTLVYVGADIVARLMNVAPDQIGADNIVRVAD